jgi:cytidylate kinase
MRWVLRTSDNRDNRDDRYDRYYRLYEIDRDDLGSFDKTRFEKKFAKQGGRFAYFSIF